MEDGLCRFDRGGLPKASSHAVTISETCSCIFKKGLSASGVLRSARALSASGATTAHQRILVREQRVLQTQGLHREHGRGDLRRDHGLSQG